MKEQYVKLSDVKDILAEAGLVTEYYDGEYESVSGYNVDDVNDGLAELPVYEFEDPDTQDQKTEEPVSLCKYRNEDKCSMYCSGFDTACESYEPVDKVREEDSHED